MPKRLSQQHRGLLPSLALALWRGFRWMVRHPQGVMIAALPVLCAVGVWYATIRSPLFRVTQIVVPPESTLKIPDALIGQPLWSVDIHALAQKLHAQQPQLKRVRVIRRIPNALQIDVLSRIPVAQVRVASAARRWHFLDAEGMVFGQGSAQPVEGLVRITGLDEARAAALKVGRVNTHPAVAEALRLTARVRQSPALVGRRFSALDVSDPQQLSFVLDETIEIRCGSADDLATHLARLEVVLTKLASHHIDAGYIDVRFAEPVVSPQT